jgi:hypothetical protein
MGAGDLIIEVDEWAGEFERQQTSGGTLASSHESDEGEQRSCRILGH